MGMFGPKLGTWWVSSKVDARWNKNGRGYGLVTAVAPGEINEWMEVCRREFGPPPDDLEVGFMKD